MYSNFPRSIFFFSPHTAQLVRVSLFILIAIFVRSEGKKSPTDDGVSREFNCRVPARRGSTSHSFIVFVIITIKMFPNALTANWIAAGEKMSTVTELSGIICLLFYVFFFVFFGSLTRILPEYAS